MGQIVLNSQIQTDARDFEALTQAFFEYARNNFSDIWNDENEDQFMRLIAELIAYEGDLLMFYLDRQTMENFLATARLRQSVIDICKMLDYHLSSGVPSSGQITLTIDNTLFDYLTPIPAGFRVGNGVLTFETTKETLVPLNATSVILDVIEGETKRETLLVDGALGISDGTGYQRFTLDQRNVILSSNLVDLQNSLTVTVGGASYSPVFNIVTSQSSEKVFVVETNDKDETTLVFGNGIFGLIPPSGAAIEATYRFLLDSRIENTFGNVNAGTITTLIDTITGVVEVTNASAMTGGRDKESIEEARVNAPLSLKAGDRAVSDSDYKILAELYPGVAKATALKSAIDPLDVDLYVAPDGGGLPSQTLKNGLIVYFQPRKMMRTKVFVRDPIYQDISLSLRVQIEPNNRNSDIQTAINAALTELFDFDNMQFGRGVFLKTTGGLDVYDLNETIEGIDGIATVKYNKVTLKPVAYGKKFNNTGTPEFFAGGAKIRKNSYRREFEAAMQSPTEFLLKSKEFGTSTSLNDTRLEDNLKTFLLDDGSSTSVAALTLVDENQFWENNAYSGQTLIDSAGNHFLISSNDADTLTLSVGTPTAGSYQIVRRLVGQFLNPNSERTSVFKIISNDANSVSVASGLSEGAVIGDNYEIYRYETNKYHALAHEGTETSGSATATQFVDSSTIGDGDDFYNDMYVIFQDGPAANIPVKVLDFVSATGLFTVQTLGLGNSPLITNRYVVAPAYRVGLKTTVSSSPSPTTTQFSGNAIGGEGNDFFNDYTVYFLTGTLEGQARKVTDYDDLSNDTLTTPAFSAAPVPGTEFQLVREYQLDDKSATFGLVSTNVGVGDVYLWQMSDLVGDLTPKSNQILQLNPEDLELIVVGGS